MNTRFPPDKFLRRPCHRGLRMTDPGPGVVACPVGEGRQAVSSGGGLEIIFSPVRYARYGREQCCSEAATSKVKAESDGHASRTKARKKRQYVKPNQRVVIKEKEAENGVLWLDNQ